MKKFVNIRIPVILACCLVAGIATGYFFDFYKINILWLLASLPLGSVLIIILCVLRKSCKPIIFIVLAMLFALGGVFLSVVKLNDFKVCDVNLTENNKKLVYGSVVEKGKRGNYEYIILSDAYADGDKLSGKVYAKLYETYGDYCDVGDNVNFYTELQFNDLYQYGKLNYNVQENVKYSCTVYGGVQSEYNFSLFGSIRSAIYDALNDNTDKDTAAVCFGMLTGNTQYIEDNSLQSFRYGGIAHIFAVSGLHIGIIFGLLSFLFKKFNANKYLSAVFCVAAIFFYCGVCGFSASSLRAAIMCAVALLCNLVYVKNDSLNSLAFAVIILLLIYPLNLFSVGFQLSVCAVGGIAIFSKGLSFSFRKIKLPEKLASALSVSFSAQLGTLPVMLLNFGYISGAGLLLNVIIIPVLSALFSVIFLSTAISAAIPAVGATILPVATAPLDAIISFLLNAGFENALISGFGAGLFTLLYFIFVLSLSDKLNLKIISRSICICISIAALSTYVVVRNNSPYNGYDISVSAFDGGGDVIIKSQNGSVLVVSDYINSSSILSHLNANYTANPTAVIVVGGEDSAIIYKNLDVQCKDVYVCYLNIDVQPYRDITVHYEKLFKVCGIDFEFINSNTLIADCGGVKTAICTDASYNRRLNECDLIISKYADIEIENVPTIYFGFADGKQNVYSDGAYKFNASGGKLKKSFNVL